MRIPRWCIIAFIVVAALTGSAIVLALRPALSALAVKRDIARIRDGKFDEKALRQWTSKHGGRVTCANGRCEGSIYIANMLLNVLHLAPLTRFDAEVDLANNQPVQIVLSLSDVQYLRGVSGATTSVVINYQATNGWPGAEDSVVLGGPHGKRPSRSYIVRQGSSQSAVALAFCINPWCLAQLGGCTPNQQAPGIWALPLTTAPPGESPALPKAR